MIVPREVSCLKAGCETVGKTRVGEVESGHLALEPLVGHTGSVAVDDAQVGWGSIIRGGIAVGGRHVEHKTLACGVPLFGFVFLLCVLFLDVFELFALEFVLVFSLLVGARHPGHNGTKEVAGVLCG